MKNRLNLFDNKSKINEIVKKLYKYGYLKPDDYKSLTSYKREVEQEFKRYALMIEEYGSSSEVLTDYLKKLEEEHRWLEEDVQLYRSTRISILELHFTADRPFTFIGSGYTNNSFFDFKRLVEKINAYYEIAEPYKAPNKIAYGWNFCMDKIDDTGYYSKGARAYLFVCIRNYLQRNNVKFETKDIQKIVGLKDVEEGDA